MTEESKCCKTTVTVVVILTSVFFGLYLFTIDQILLNLVEWVFRKFGAA